MKHNELLGQRKPQTKSITPPRPRPTPAEVAALDQRVALLIRQGMSMREVAALLDLSTAAASRIVQRIIRKPSTPTTEGTSHDKNR